MQRIRNVGRRVKSFLRRLAAPPADAAVPPPAAAPARPVIYVGDGRLLTMTRRGHKMFLHSRDVGITPQIALSGVWEPNVTDLVARLLRPAMNYLEVGANVGYFSVLAADLVGPTGRVVALEANPTTAVLLRHNLFVNGFSDRATVIPKAAYSEECELEFCCFDRFNGGSGLYGTRYQAELYADTATMIKVPAVRVDDVVPAGARIDVFKIDAEGAEPHVLRGARRVLSENPDVALIVEVLNPDEESAPRSRAILEILTSAGFRLHLIHDDGEVRPQSAADILRLPFSEIFARRAA